MLSRILALIGTWGAALVVLFWGSLPFRWRRVFALFTSACGVAFLLLGLQTEGLRESPTVGSILMGAPYVAERVSASASLPYYVVTGVLLALGFIGLAAGDGFVLELSRRPLLNAVLFSWAVTGLRVVLEKAAAPEPWARLIGITWLAPVVGAYFALCLKSEGRGLKDLLLRLAAYAFAVRGAVALIMIVASAFQLGTHYDVSRLGDVYFLGRRFHLEAGAWQTSLSIAGFSQLVFWPIYTVLSGLVGAAVGLF
ncbi:MAG TPA: hypothetical protein VI589_08005, partial [Vicinamibacteria bacterium]